MKKSVIPYLLTIFTILGNGLPGAGIVLLFDRWFGFGWPHILILAGVFFFETALYLTEKLKICLKFWAILMVLNAAAGVIIYKKAGDIEIFLIVLGMEAACAGAAYFCYLARKKLWLKAPVITLLFIGLIYFGAESIEMEKWEVCVILLSFLLFLTETAEEKRIALSGGKNTINRQGANARGRDHSTIYMFPSFLVLVIVLLLLPVKSTPISWQFLIDMAEAAVQKVTAALNGIEVFFSDADSTYSVSFTGYDPDGHLGGSILSDDAIQVTVEGMGTNSPLYLAGTIFTEYTGQGWKMQENPYGEDDYLYSYQKLTDALSNGGYTAQEIQGITRQRSYTVSYEKLRTETLFTVPNTIAIVLPEKTTYSAGEGGNLILDNSKSTGFSYRIRFLEVNYASEEVEALMRQEELNGTAQGNEEDRERSTFIYENDTGLPKDLPQRVRDLADHITEGAETDYDRLKAIEAYLNTLAYTTTPKTAPEGQDFTDYFLFESKSGYCTYFATAMAVLARCEGIPARYVEGFVTGDTLGREGIIELKGQNAHAWAEAYIDSVGWVPFEPTPGYYNAVPAEWEQPDVRQAALPDWPLREESKQEENTERIEDAEPEIPDKDNIGSIIRSAGRVLIILCLAVLLIFCIKTVQIYLSRQSYEKKDSYEKVIDTMQKILLLGARTVGSIGQGETLTAYSTRIGSGIDTKGDTFEEICMCFKSIRFGGKDAEAEDVSRFEHYAGDLEQQYLKSSNLPKKLLYFLDKR